MAKKRIDIILKSGDESNNDYIMIGNERRDIQELINLLTTGIKTNVVKRGIARINPIFTEYIFESYFSDELNNFVEGNICVRVKNYDKKLIKSLSQIENLCENRIKMKKTNYRRIFNGLRAIVLTTPLAKYVYENEELTSNMQQDYYNSITENEIYQGPRIK